MLHVEYFQLDQKCRTSLYTQKPVCPIYCCRVIYKYSTEKALLLIMKMQERVFAPFAYYEQQYFLLNRD